MLNRLPGLLNSPTGKEEEGKQAQHHDVKNSGIRKVMMMGSSSSASSSSPSAEAGGGRSATEQTSSKNHSGAELDAKAIEWDSSQGRMVFGDIVTANEKMFQVHGVLNDMYVFETNENWFRHDLLDNKYDQFYYKLSSVDVDEG